MMTNRSKTLYIGITSKIRWREIGFPIWRRNQMHRSFDFALACARAPLRMTELKLHGQRMK